MGNATNAIAENLERIRERIARAAHRAGRKPEAITLVAVSKMFPAEAIREAYAAGVRHFGENRVQEWESKQPHLADLDAAWHLVGHLQSNKAARAARLFHSVDSVDSVALAQRLDRSAAEAGSRRLSVLIEGRLDKANTKSGVAEAELPRLAGAFPALPHLELRGLMCVPPFCEEPEQVRPYFRKLRELRDRLRPILADSWSGNSAGGEESLLPELSMGMSHDYEVAIEEGATQVRLGAAVFGVRKAV